MLPIAFPATDGVTLRGEQWGTGPVPVLFTQGNGFAVQGYREAFASVLDRVTVHAVNCRGQGGSDIPARLDTWDEMVEDLRRYLKAHFNGPTLVAGHSMGATVSMRLTAESPELVAGLLLLEPNLLKGRNEVWPQNNTGIQQQMVDMALKRRERWSNRAEAAAWLRERGTYRDWAEGPFDAFMHSAIVDDGNEVRLACPPWVEAQAYATLPGPIMYQWVDHIQVPTVIVKAEQSPVVSEAGLEDFIKAVPVTTVFRIKGSHSFPMQNPRIAGDAIRMGIDVLLRATAPKASKG